MPRCYTLLRLLALVCLCALPPLAAAATFFVSPGGSDGNAGTEGQPFQSIARGLQAVGAGDTLYLRGGSYGGYFMSGAVRSGVTIAGYPGERPQVQGMIDLSTGSGINGVTFKDFVLTGAAGNNAVYLGTEYVSLQNMEIAYHPGPPPEGPYNGIQVYGNRNTLLNVTVHPSVYANATRTHGIYVSGAYNVFDGITSYDNGGYGIQIYNGGDNTSAHDNVIRNSTITHNGGSANPGGITVNSGANNLVYNNVIEGTIGGGGIDVTYSAIGTQLLRNTIRGNAGAAITVASLGKVATSGTVIADNSTGGNGQDIVNHVGDTTVGANMPLPSIGGMPASPQRPRRPTPTGLRVLTLPQ